MVIDVLCTAFVALLAVFGWHRGLISQVITIGAAVLLWFTRPLWEEAAGSILVHLGSAFSYNPFLRKMTAFVLLYLVVVLLVLIIERKVIRKVGPLRWTNHWLGAALGASKGLIYTVAILWTVQTVVLWKQAPSEPEPQWMSESRALQIAGPWNPVRLFTLQEIVEEIRTRANSPDTEDQTSERKQAIAEAPPVRELVDDLDDDESWSRARYLELMKDPRVKKILDEPGLKSLLFGN
ncbi:MAG: CvpA family protein [Myxococcota bacterium]|nr:CvpA family protein [Myxococcota bacterium]